MQSTTTRQVRSAALTTEPNDVFGPIHPKEMPVILTTADPLELVAANQSFTCLDVSRLNCKSAIFQLNFEVALMSDYLNVVADISDHQTNVDFKVAINEIRGVFIKATQGVGKPQKYYATRRLQAKKAGLLVGSYHFAEAGSGRAQADYYLSIAGDEPDELLVLDIERWKIHGSDQPPMTLSQAHDFVQRIHDKTGRWPGIYGGEYLKSILGNQPDPILSNCWPWIAQYGPKPVWPKKVWKNWTFWQYTGDGIGEEPHDVPGIGKNIDRDKFIGVPAELEQFWTGEKLRTLALSDIEISAPPETAIASFSKMMSEIAAKSDVTQGRGVPLFFPNGIDHIEFSIESPVAIKIVVSGFKPLSPPALISRVQPSFFSSTDEMKLNVELRDEADPDLFLTRGSDASYVSDLIECGSTPQGLKAARTLAKQFLPQYPHNGCAAHLSALLQLSGIDFKETVGAGDLANRLAKRGWKPVNVGQQRPGDVGVTFDDDPSIPGPDHVYLVVGTKGPDEMMIADNQRKEDAPHRRYASGYGGKTPTEYFLRAI